jgi:hypothetical protein
MVRHMALSLMGLALVLGGAASTPQLVGLYDGTDQAHCAALYDTRLERLTLN